MNLSKQSKTVTGHLPKSVKVRSTCNACQQAKIRCSHEKPSCRRCQKHDIDCIYSVSRRLGRPSKKKESRVGLEDSQELLYRPEREKKMRKSTSKKTHAAVITVAVEEERPVPGPADGNADDSFETSQTHNWLQDLMPVHRGANSGYSIAEQIHADFELDVEDSFESLSSYQRHFCPSSLFTQPGDMGLSSNPLEEPTLAPVCLKQDLDNFPVSVMSEQAVSLDLEDCTVPWGYDFSRLDMQPFQGPWSVGRMSSINLFIDPSNFCHNFQSPERHNSENSSPQLGLMPSFSCTCYQQAMDELTKARLRMSHDGISSIDSIIASQKELSLQTETILQCKMCSQSEIQVNMLMMIIVTIDSLLTALEKTALPGNLEEESKMSYTGASFSNRQAALTSGFKSSVDACPLLVGAYKVPVEDKASFIHQVLQVRLFTLLLTIRRIRVCAQHHSSGPSSRGRLFMIMETDRRLQLMMMRIKMMVT
ncbi:hypothetical protein N7495_004849 [Penicillium taxi]|uniref:uncharacterized protein n=1 Tax=Penicillium taxi TaxID=168475 RepID=UPI0025455C20|nr:uncharacterized protein N7495_004849 [Penicillium taxi]KAJ5900105.1 hypothetical protein N7495_004849 [Penicillium taxi]